MIKPISTPKPAEQRPSRLRAGYGSEWHLLRYLGRHRKELSNLVRRQTKAISVDWLDFGFTEMADADHNYGDRELTGVEFLPARHAARGKWQAFWPQRGSAQNWDAVASLDFGSHRDWLLVEAKANVEELISATGAKAHGGLPRIRAALSETKRAMGVDEDRDWTKPYYQFANRLAFLHFLTSQGLGTRLCFIYFTGDEVPGRTCPSSEDDWHEALVTMKGSLGLTGASSLEARIHYLFLPVVPHPVRTADGPS